MGMIHTLRELGSDGVTVWTSGVLLLSAPVLGRLLFSKRLNTWPMSGPPSGPDFSVRHLVARP